MCRANGDWMLCHPVSVISSASVCGRLHIGRCYSHFVWSPWILDTCSVILSVYVVQYQCAGD